MEISYHIAYCHVNEILVFCYENLRKFLIFINFGGDLLFIFGLTCLFCLFVQRFQWISFYLYSFEKWKKCLYPFNLQQKHKARRASLQGKAKRFRLALATG